MNLQTLFFFHKKILNKTSWQKSIKRGYCDTPNQFKRPLILGIETSCDDTGAAIGKTHFFLVFFCLTFHSTVDSRGNILGEALASQLNQHLSFGGIIPPVAADMHRQNIEQVVNSALAASGVSIDSDIDAIAVTNRPGLQLSILVGLRYAKHLSRKYKKRLIPVHHMEAHALTVRSEQPVSLPFLCLLVSGGHCLLSVCREIDQFLLLGESIDDAPGEAFDKIARRMKLRNIPEYRNLSGGQAIELAASRADKLKDYYFPLPLARQRDCQFSFSGLKNTANRHIYREEKENDTAIDGVFPGFENFSLSLLKAIVRHICHRTQRAIQFCEEQKVFGDDTSRKLVISGGVACNDFLFTAVSQLGQQYGYKVVRPSRRLCTDNGIMIAWNGVERYKVGKGVFEDIDNVDVFGKCRLGENWIDKLKHSNLQCKWAKLPILRDET